MSRASTKTKVKKAKKSSALDLVHLRQVLEELGTRENKEPMLEMAMGLLGKCNDVIEDMSHQLAVMRMHRFGRRSEKVSTDQLSLFAKVLQTVSGESPGGDANKDAENADAKGKGKGKGQKRRPLVPTITVNIPVPDNERACPKCGKERCAIGCERTMVIEYTPPKIDVIEYLREKLACRPCEGEIQVAPAPSTKVIDGALPGPQMLAALAVGKLVDGMPLHRTRRVFSRSGLDLPVQTLNRWEGFGHQLLSPLIDVIRKGVLESDTINLDDTGIKVRDPTIERGTRRGHVWVFVGRKYDPGGDLSKTVELVHYLYAPTWAAKYPDAYLKDCTAVLQGDAYKGYDRITEPIKGEVKNLLAGCMMHARRSFARAFEAGDPLAGFFIERFQKIYRVEKDAKERGLRAHERLELRQAHSRPVLNEIRSQADELSALPLAKPMKDGVGYLQNQWDRLMVPFDIDGRLDIDNGSAERYLRRVASGRKSWLFAGSDGGATRFADMLSMVSSAEAEDIDPGTYLADCLERIASDWPNRRLHDLLPRRWKSLQNEAEKASPAD